MLAPTSDSRFPSLHSSQPILVSFCLRSRPGLFVALLSLASLYLDAPFPFQLRSAAFIIVITRGKRDQRYLAIFSLSQSISLSAVCPAQNSAPRLNGISLALSRFPSLSFPPSSATSRSSFFFLSRRLRASLLLRFPSFVLCSLQTRVVCRYTYIYIYIFSLSIRHSASAERRSFSSHCPYPHPAALACDSAGPGRGIASFWLARVVELRNFTSANGERARDVQQPRANVPPFRSAHRYR